MIIKDPDVKIPIIVCSQLGKLEMVASTQTVM